MKKIGIISELTLINANYGNRLQAYALNKYISNNYNYYVTSLITNKINYKKRTLNLLKRGFYKIKEIPYISTKKSDISERIKKCNDFTNLINYKEYFAIRDIVEENYDILIVGSDVVWAQFHGGVNELKFLNIPEYNGKKISYGASFGKNWIPDENKKIIYNDLTKFDGISVREKSSIELLGEIGIKNVKHVCDPTLLLDSKEWRKEEIRCKCVKCKYIFTYLLGDDSKQKEHIKKYAKIKHLKIVNIPNSNGIYNKSDENFGDINIKDCSPQEWLWLIDNAEYIFTDSFHGTIFSSIFEKKFFIIKRKYSIDINVRMTDYLKYINQYDKFISEFADLDEKIWDYSSINKKLAEFRKKSISYLDDFLKE